MMVVTLKEHIIVQNIFLIYADERELLFFYLQILLWNRTSQVKEPERPPKTSNQICRIIQSQKCA
jgi:hypothetical protein